MQPTEEYNICMKCKHFNNEGIGCKAFPQGIPVDRIIELGHDDVYDDQTGEYVFEELPFEVPIE